MFPSKPIFFDELGLDSLTIALAISRMRASLSTRAATVRMAYRHRTARSIADELDEIGRAEKNNPARQPSAPLPAIGTSRPILATTLQALFLLILLLGASQILWIPHAGERVASALYGPFATGLALASIAGLLWLDSQSPRSRLPLRRSGFSSAATARCACARGA